MKYVFFLILIFLLNLILTYLFIPIFRKYFLDIPVTRSSHIKPIPSGGGIIFSITSTIFSTINGWYIPLACIPISIIGFLDDKFNVSRVLRYLSHLFTVFVLFMISENFFVNEFISTKTTPLALFFIVLGIFFFLTAIINFFNFMDGIDGLVGIIFLIYLIYLAYIESEIKIILVICLLSFLCFNWFPAKLFMGDSGSTFLGSIYVGTLLESDNQKELIVKIILLTPLLSDAFFTLINRLISKQNVFSPHKLHLYQRLVQNGFSHSKVSLIYGLGTLTLCLVSLTSNIFLLFFISFFEITIGLYLNHKFAVPFDKNYS